MFTHWFTNRQPGGGEVKVNPTRFKGEDEAWAWALKEIGKVVGVPVEHLSELNESYGVEHRIYPIVRKGRTKIASFTLVQLPGCCGVQVSTGAWVAPEYRRRGLGTILNELRIYLSRIQGYGCLLCTDLLSNTPQRRLLSKLGWKDIHTFQNPRTTNQIAISVKEL